ncbi:MAG: SIMPL domain-containing protein [Candidatus Gracilibacteria bacterium]
MDKDTSAKVLRYAGSAFLVAAACVMVWQMTGPSWFKNIRAEITNQPYARTITVAGEGKISAKPDIANISLSVVSKGATVKQVTADNNTKMNQVLGAVKGLGVDAKDITTSQYSLYPEYDYSYLSKSGVNKIIGYNLTQEITVKVRDLQKVDDILDSATKAGANQVGALAFDLDDAGSVKKEARAKAFDKAKEKAQEMASMAGVRLGRVVTFSEEAPAYPYPQYNFAMEAKMDAGVTAAPSIEPGQKELTMSVSVTYEIE